MRNNLHPVQRVPQVSILSGGRDRVDRKAGNLDRAELHIIAVRIVGLAKPPLESTLAGSVARMLVVVIPLPLIW
jgi:hypothetical protein